MDAKDNNLLLADFSNHLLNDKGYRNETEKAYILDMVLFSRFLNFKSFLDVKENDVIDYKYYLIKLKKAKATINRKITVIRSFYSFLIRKKIVKENPAAYISKLKLPQTVPIILSESESNLLLDGILATSQYAVRDYAIFSTFLLTGCRVSEIIKLQRSDINFDSNYIHIRDAKGGKDRIVPLIPKLAEILKIYLYSGVVYEKQRKIMKTKVKEVTKISKYKSGRDYFNNDDSENTLFLSKYGKPFSEKGIEYLFRKYTQQFGIYRDGLSLHALRRTCLTFLYKRGVDLFTLKEISGHADIKTLQHYLRIDETQIYEAMQKHPLATGGISINKIDIFRKFL